MLCQCRCRAVCLPSACSDAAARRNARTAVARPPTDALMQCAGSAALKAPADTSARKDARVYGEDSRAPVKGKEGQQLPAAARARGTVRRERAPRSASGHRLLRQRGDRAISAPAEARQQHYSESRGHKHFCAQSMRDFIITFSPQIGRSAQTGARGAQSVLREGASPSLHSAYRAARHCDRVFLFACCRHLPFRHYAYATVRTPRHSTSLIDTCSCHVLSHHLERLRPIARSYALSVA